MDLQTTPHDAVAESRRAVDRTDPGDLWYGLRISVWVRWFLLIAWLLQFNYRPNFADPAYIPTTLLAVSALHHNPHLSANCGSGAWVLIHDGMEGTVKIVNLVYSVP